MHVRYIHLLRKLPRAKMFMCRSLKRAAWWEVLEGIRVVVKSIGCELRCLSWCQWDVSRFVFRCTTPLSREGPFENESHMYDMYDMYDMVWYVCMVCIWNDLEGEVRNPEPLLYYKIPRFHDPNIRESEHQRIRESEESDGQMVRSLWNPRS